VTDIRARPLDAAAFAPFGQVIAAAGAPDVWINGGRCGRFHDLAPPDIVDGRAGISLFQTSLTALPYSFDMVERHPRGSQAFLPMSHDGFLVIVAPDTGGTPGQPLAFLTAPGQGVSIGRGVWHGVLTALTGSGLFAVVDRVGPGPNLEEFRLTGSYRVVR